MQNFAIIAAAIWFIIAFSLALAKDPIDDFEIALGFGLFWPMWLLRAIFRGFFRVWDS